MSVNTETAPTTSTQRLLDEPRRTPLNRLRPFLGLALFAIAAMIPFSSIYIPGLFSGPLASPGVLHLLALMCVTAAIAITYDLLFGYTGLLSFGHGLYVALGMYTTVIVLNVTGKGLGHAALYVLGVGIVAPLILGAICLRVDGIAFAMATLAFSQAGAILVLRDPFDVTGGELGKPLPYQQIPESLVGVFNAHNRYWLALGALGVIAAISVWALRSRPGHVWQAIRENPARVAVLGLRPYSFKLLAFVLSSFLATAIGAVYAIVSNGAHSAVTQSTFTLGLLVMVVLGGTGRKYGALIGGLLYTYLNHRLGEVSADFPGLPAPMREPMFILGTVFVVIVLILPGGITSIGRRSGRTVRDRIKAMLSGKNNAATPKGTP